MKFSRRALVVLVLFLLSLCSQVSARDWEKDPPWVEIPYAPKVAVVGDVHGAFPEFAASLECLGVAKRTDPDGFELAWTGGDAVLIFTGDFNDRGMYTREVQEAVMSLEVQAHEAGGKVIPILGNHEILLLNGTVEKWANTLKPPKKQHYQNTIDSYTKAGLDFHQAISESGKYGSWIRRRPLFAIVNGFLFVHGGLPKPAISRSDLAADFREVLDRGNFNAGLFMDDNGPLWNREWWDDKGLVEENLKLFGVRGVVFGHTVGAMGKTGDINTKDCCLVGIDIGMTPVFGASKGGGLLITIQDTGKMAFRARFPDRPEKVLFQVPAPSPAGSIAEQPLRGTGTWGW